MSTSFNSEELTLLTAVLDRACAEMQISDEASRSMVAMRIMHRAQEGIRAPEILLQYAKCLPPAVAA